MMIVTILIGAAIGGFMGHKWFGPSATNLGILVGAGLGFVSGLSMALNS